MRVALLSSGRWSEFRGSMHELARATAGLGHDTLYVDPPVSPLSVLRHRERSHDLFGDRDLQVENHLRVWRPVVVPAQNSAIGQRLNASLVRRGVEARLASADVTIAFTPEARGALRRTGGTRIYSCIDSLEDLPGIDPEQMRRRERALIDAVDHVVVCSKPLQRQLAERGVVARYIPHGCDPTFVRPPDPVPLPPELVGRPRPFVGYVGSMNFRLDAALLDAAHRACQGGTLVLVGGRWSSAGPGPVTAVDDLARTRSVVAVGHRDAADLGPYLWALDVGVVPYANTPFNQKSYPLKIPQYLAAGASVVSTPNGATEEMGGLVREASSPAGFHDAVRHAIEDSSGMRARRAAGAARPWATVAAETLAVVAGCA